MLKTVDSRQSKDAVVFTSNLDSVPDDALQDIDKSDCNNKMDKADTGKKQDRKSDQEDPKPRIVLTFRSEKPGAKSSAMKIVNTEEKHDEVSPRRSNRARSQKYDSEDENELISPKKDNMSISENDEASDGSHTASKRSMRRRSKDMSDSVLANAIARKEKSYNDTSSTPNQRPSRRIKPTAKILANKELESQTRTGAEKSPEEGVKTRRSTRRKSPESDVEKKTTKRAYNAGEEAEVSNDVQQVKKLKHLCELGLKAITPEMEDDAEVENREVEIDDIEAEISDEVDDEEEVINKLLEADGETGPSESSDEEFYCSTDASQGERPRRSTRLCSSYGVNENEDRSSPTLVDDEQKAQPRRSARKTKVKDPYVAEYECNPAGGDEGSEATCPDEESSVIATCFCETPSNVYAAPDDLIEPVFCQAIDVVDQVRVGCSHSARREGDSGSYAALVRAGPRAPYFVSCALHASQLHSHMCCPACGLFCTQGIFYQCSEGHLFHVDCGLPYNESKHRPGCPHCGVYSYRWQPVNRECVKVRVQMNCSNKQIFLPDQRVQCTPAYLSFSKLDLSRIQQGPVIPEDLLPSPPINLKQLCNEAEPDYDELIARPPAQRLLDAIIAGEPVDKLIPKIMKGMELNKQQMGEGGGTYAHAAAQCGNLAALYLLQYAGAGLDAPDAAGRTPLMRAVLALLDKSQKKVSKETEDAADERKDKTANEKGKDGKTDPNSNEGDTNRAEDEKFMRVIRYLVAAGCDVNVTDPEGMTALHLAAQHGGDAVCAAILSCAGAEIDPRDHGGWTPLVWAAENKHPAVVRLLVSEGADAGATDNEGNCVVHWCALAGDARSLQQLLDAAPHAATAVNAHADTPLHVAARQGHYACVIILLARGARTDIENSAGELPVEVCTGECQNAISLNMQMALTVRDMTTKYRLLSSDISKGREHFPVPCVNEVDDAPLPDDFTYVTRHVMPTNIVIDCTIDSMQGCSCADGSCCGSCACSVLSVRRWFERGRLARSFPYHEPPMLFECNQTCSCNMKRCGNSTVTRLLERGSTLVPSVVFRAGGARGWGLRAAAHVSRGTPVATYCGELLPLPAADARPADHYMFALDIKPDLLEQCADKTQLCVDAARYGSAARFINHSCRPNLAPVRLFTATRDLRLPHVTLFATGDVRAGDEFTFDYGEKFWSVKSKWMRCECGAPDCRYSARPTEESDS